MAKQRKRVRREDRLIEILSASVRAIQEPECLMFTHSFLVIEAMSSHHVKGIALRYCSRSLDDVH